MSNEWVEAEEEMAEEYAAPRKPFVRLTDEEIMECHRRTISVTRFANAMQDLLEEKNR